MVAIYDIIAVLCPAGPLRLLIDMAVERGEDIPALIYTAGMADFDRHNRNGESGIMGISTRENFDLSTNQNQNVRNAFFSGTVRNIMRRDGYEPVVVSDEDQRDDDEMIVEGERNINSEIESESYRDCPRVGDDEPADDLYDDDLNPIKLGLGDFIFYSVLVGRASRTDAVTLTICTMAVLTGLTLTILLLTLRRQALPALPISIMLGTTAYFISATITSGMIVHIGKSLNIVILVTAHSLLSRCCSERLMT
ncbi:Presenilin-domain-containing protein, partial [Jimgerdemannia flammicorona]